MSDEPIGWYTELQIDFADGTSQRIEIERKATGTHIPQLRGKPAPWAKLGFQKCPCCPLPGDLGSCPAALSLQTTLEKLRHRTSTEIVTAAAVDAAGRRQTVTEPLQLVGAVMVQLAVFSSECPVGRRVKPYLHGLSPFTPAADMLKHILKGILAAKGGSVDATRKSVQEIIAPLHEVFDYLVRRLRGGEAGPSHEDAIPNSIVHVDTLAQMMAYRATKLNEQMTAELGWRAGQGAAAEDLAGGAPPAELEKPGLLGKLKGLFGR